jgi:4-alpha-glucanotransferase
VINLARASGVLLHPTSLPGRWGVGDLGPQAVRFADFLAAAGQSWWQLLPVGPTGYGNSPYMCFSAFAGNPLLVSPERLVEHGLLRPDELERHSALPGDRVDFPSAIKLKRELLMRSFETFQSSAPHAHREGLLSFVERNAEWLEDYALFMAIKESHGGQAWTRWEPELVSREPQALQDASRRLRGRVEFHRFVQYVFSHQWHELRESCHRRGIRIIGDLPIYVAHDSAEVWSHPELFYLDEYGKPRVVAGVPPDYFSATGQRWGNPIYRWEERAKSGFGWWIGRFRANLALVDLVRLDHFRGFEAYWEIPESETEATHGRWVKGPGAKFFAALESALGTLPVIAEDLGVITPEVEALRDEFALPGMKILQMAFGADPKAASYQPHNHPQNCVVYTATHDHNTTVGWFTAEPGRETTQSRDEIHAERALALKYLGTDGREIHWDVIRLAMSSVAKLAIFPLQDVLGLGTEARMNRPGAARGNWEWRFGGGALEEGHAARLRDLGRLYDRLPATGSASEAGPGGHGAFSRPVDDGARDERIFRRKPQG